MAGINIYKVQLSTDKVKETSETRQQNTEKPIATVGSVRQAWRVIQIGGTGSEGQTRTRTNLKTAEIDKTTFRLQSRPRREVWKQLSSKDGERVPPISYSPGSRAFRESAVEYAQHILTMLERASPILVAIRSLLIGKGG